MYKVGDRVVYPMHGAGEIISIEERTILGKTQKYFVLKIPVNDMKIMIPVNNINDMGVRDIIGKEDADKVYLLFDAFEAEVTVNWNKRYRENMCKIKSGNIFEVAEVVKTLMKIDLDKGLSTGEKKMLSSAKQILVSELIFAWNMEKDQIEEYLKSRCI